MKVSEVIAKLRELSDDALVCIADVDPDFKVRLFVDVVSVDKIVDSRGNEIALLSVEEW
ncbi:MAG: hypothetical protein LBK55_06485 [Azoarcus sp.]|jgi:hypothetical protein|nr:hypothetical protein [Azoarcus sp.]